MDPITQTKIEHKNIAKDHGDWTSNNVLHNLVEMEWKNIQR